MEQQPPDGEPALPGVPVRVVCYEGYRAQETPRRFCVAGREVGVREIVDRWVSPEWRYFKVVGTDGRWYILGCHEGQGTWRLVAGSSTP